MLRHAMLSYAMLCHAMLCYAMLCYAMLCYALMLELSTPDRVGVRRTCRAFGRLHSVGKARLFPAAILSPLARQETSFVLIILYVRGSRLSKTTCLTHGFFKRGE